MSRYIGVIPKARRSILSHANVGINSEIMKYYTKIMIFLTQKSRNVKIIQKKQLYKTNVSENDNFIII